MEKDEVEGGTENETLKTLNINKLKLGTETT